VFQNVTKFVSDLFLNLFCIFNTFQNVRQTEGIHAAFNVEPRIASLEKSNSFKECFTLF